METKKWIQNFGWKATEENIRAAFLNIFTLDEPLK
jgi:hypothetical protein